MVLGRYGPASHALWRGGEAGVSGHTPSHDFLPLPRKRSLRAGELPEAEGDVLGLQKSPAMLGCLLGSALPCLALPSPLL